MAADPVVNEAVNSIFTSFDEGAKRATHVFWDWFLSFLSQHWLSITIFLTIILLFAVFEAKRGRWGMLGSVLYNYLYFWILFMVGSILGPEVFISNYFNIACTVLLYPICYFTVGIILEKIGLIHKARRRPLFG